MGLTGGAEIALYWARSPMGDPGDVMKTIVSLALFSILISVGCAQRLERQAKLTAELPQEARFSKSLTPRDATPKAHPSVVVNPDQSVAPQPAPAAVAPQAESSQLPIENPARAEPVAPPPGTLAPVLTVPGVPASETPVACGIEFKALEESAGAAIMKAFEGFWIEDGLATLRSVQNNALNATTRPALSLGAKNDEIYVAKVGFRQASKLTPGRSPFEVSSVEKKARAFSYIVGPTVNGFRLVQFSLMGDKSSKMSCLTFGLKMDPASAGMLNVAGPLKTMDSLAHDGDAKVHSYRREHNLP